MKSRAYIGTWNSFPENYVELLMKYEKYAFQEEIGKSGNHHVQFAIYCKNPCKVTTLHEQLPGAHIEVAKSWKACETYCGKNETAVEGTFKTNVKDKKTKVRKMVKDPLEGREPLPLQREILQLLENEPDDRTIVWIHDPSGSSGKTTLAKHLCLTRDDVIYLTGKAADMKFGVMSWLKKRDLGVVLIDLARSQEGFVSYQGIEEIKNAIFFNTKYESEMVMYPDVHLIVFSNFYPETHKLTNNRWYIIEAEHGTVINGGYLEGK